MKSTKIRGTLQIDHNRGVIYFNSDKGACILRICRLPQPIPTVFEEDRMLDITHMYGCDWSEESLIK